MGFSHSLISFQFIELEKFTYAVGLCSIALHLGLEARHLLFSPNENKRNEQRFSIINYSNMLLIIYNKLL